MLDLWLIEDQLLGITPFLVGVWWHEKIILEDLKIKWDQPMRLYSDNKFAIGAIELSILADYYGREIAAYDIQTGRCDVYGQEAGYDERVMLIYDGLHYDALAVASKFTIGKGCYGGPDYSGTQAGFSSMSPFDGAPEEFDQTVFTVQTDRAIGPIEELALNLVKEQQRKRRFTDTTNFTLRCGVCQIGVIGQKEAMEHARATGHVNFQEYR
ncbi:Ubiquitin thioesterase OTU1 [Vitis vinifera]|uniref:Ubiquitin thioesterase OTU n=1 Tax=Vitis vinifera TaxID=29760 RepID=A0A438IS37_VITVI|nr:Ubiquitin thioesterase OTU1 [Vitis vinifera]